MSDLLHIERRERVAIVTINRPEMRNALGFGDDGDVVEAHTRRLNSDPDLRCVILTGSGPAFSAGGDLKQLHQWANDPTIKARDFFKLYEAGIHKVVRGFWNLEMPVIAAINGPAIGLGNDIACLADMRIAGECAKFGATFLKIGLVPGDGGAWILPRLIGWERAAELYFTGKIIDARTALAWNLVGNVVPDEQLMEQALLASKAICEQPPGVLRSTKKLMRAGILQAFEEIMDLSARTQMMAHLTDDHREALDALLERRPATFTGD